ncbi:hypothetical protein DPMN_050672 [Dreissena polymorpha]|uniref:THAP-type domain-containing protein n=1 Tax=Dreissena polymorpha TaxID=45954 RepID=A0A9D4CGK2_DREPO|nr:hypothetical protein DPMN_050672 [Dreissena polymorpha]
MVASFHLLSLVANITTSTPYRYFLFIPSFQIWKDRIRRSDVKISQHTRVCSYHFKFVDFVNPKSSKKRLKSEAVPSQFQWTQVEKGRSPRKSKNVDSDETDTASEGEERVHVDIHSIDKIAPLNGNR